MTKGPSKLRPPTPPPPRTTYDFFQASGEPQVIRVFSKPLWECLQMRLSSTWVLGHLFLYSCRLTLWTPNLQWALSSLSRHTLHHLVPEPWGHISILCYLSSLSSSSSSFCDAWLSLIIYYIRLLGFYNSQLHLLVLLLWYDVWTSAPFSLWPTLFFQCFISPDVHNWCSHKNKWPGKGRESEREVFFA